MSEENTPEEAIKLLFEQINQTSKAQANAINELTKVSISLLEVIDNKPEKIINLLDEYSDSIKELLREFEILTDSHKDIARKMDDVYKFNFEEIKSHLQEITDINGQVRTEYTANTSVGEVIITAEVT